MSNETFEPYGTPPRFDLEEHKDLFEVWHLQWKIYVKLSTITTALPLADQPKYLAIILRSCLSKPTLQFILNLGLTQSRVQSPTAKIDKLREHCNAGRNRHIWRLQFASMKQWENQSVDKWLILYYVYKIDLYHCHFFTMHTFHLFFNIRKMINIQKLATEFLIWAVKKTLPWL